MAATIKCGHCGSRDGLVVGNHTSCLVCGKWTDAKGEPVEHAYA